MKGSGKRGFLCVANWDSNVGYAWWLMESFWVKIAENFSGEYDVYLAYPSISKLPDPIMESALKVKDFSFDHRIGVFGLLEQLKFIRKYNIEFIYYSDRPFFSFRYAFFRAAGVKKIIVHDHTPGLRTMPKGLKKLLKYIKSRVALFNCDIVIGATEFVRRRCVDVACFPIRKCFASPNGIPLNVPDIKSALVREQYGIPDDRVLIVTTGRVTIYKGIDFAIDVLEELVRMGVSAHYIYFGDGPDLKYFQRMAARKKLENRITFAGRVDNLSHLLPSCEIAFHPSRGEVGYSLSILEYMRAGLPVIVSDNPSVREATIHEETGYIFKEGDVKSAAYWIEKLSNDKEKRHSMGENGKKCLETKYGLERCHNRLIEILRKVID